MAREKIKYMEISYPNFVLGQIIDPEEANQNNYDIVTKVNEFVDEVEEALRVADIANVQSLNAIDIANTKGDLAVSTANTAVDIANTKGDLAVSTANIAKATSDDAIIKADAVFAIKPDLEKAIVDANDVVIRIDEIVDGGIFTSVGARTLEGSFVSLVDGTLQFNIPPSLYNPATDYIEFIYMGIILEKDVNYTQNGRSITLLFPLQFDEVIRYKSIKNIMIDPTLSDGALIKNSTITDDKLDDGVGQIKDRVNELSTKIDTNVGRVNELSTKIDTNVGELQSEVSSHLAENTTEISNNKNEHGNLTLLNTTEKTNLVGAVNELFTSVSNGKNLLETTLLAKNVQVSKTGSVATFEELKNGISQLPDSKMIIYNAGNEYISQTGGWTQGYSSGSGTKSFEKLVNNMKLFVQDNGSVTAIAVSCVNKINLTKFRKLKIDLVFSQTSVGNHLDIGITNTKNGSAAAGQGPVATIRHSNANFTGIKELDISALNGDYHIAISVASASGGSTSTLYINNIVLEE